jgi:DNA-binding beta-propeller fold protein YncE
MVRPPSSPPTYSPCPSIREATSAQKTRRPLLLALAACALALCLASSAHAAAPPLLWQTGETGSGAGETRIPRGIAADSSNGHVFVADSGNNRIDVFTASGEFLRAWGWDVVTSGPGDSGSGFEICIPEDGDACKAGTAGTGPGQFGSPQGIALDSAGDVYVVDTGLPSNQRVQKFSPSGQFLLMFGKGVNTGTSPNPEICTAAGPPTDVCGPGGIGTGPGQFGEWPVTGSFIAIDTNGTEAASDDDVYVGDQNRIQRFDATGAYQSQFAVPGTVKSLATDPAGNIYAIYADQPGIHKLSTGGAPVAPETFEIPVLAPTEVPVPSAVAVDEEGNVHVFGPTASALVNQAPRDPILEFDPAGNLIKEFGSEEFRSSTGLATNLCPGSPAPGNLYVVNSNKDDSFIRAYGTDPIGCFRARTLPASNLAETAATLNGTVNPSAALSSECRFQYGTSTAYGSTAECAESPAQIGEGTEPVPVHADISGLEAGTVYHFRLRAQIKGQSETGPDETFKTLGPPLITDDHTVAVSDSEATLSALVNPEGFSTTYSFQYTTGDFSECALPANPSCLSTAETAIGSDRNTHLATAVLHGLAPGTAYRWRILAANSSGTSEGEAHTLFTYLPSANETECPNQAYRYGASAFLPDCRAYEMVSPVDKNGGDIVRESSGGDDAGNYTQASTDGNRITYTSLSSFAAQPNAFDFNQYLASRHERDEPDEGWSNQGLHTPVAGQEADPEADTFGFLREFLAFSPDLCSAWQIDHQTPPPTVDGQLGHANLYRRENCGPGAGSFEALAPSPAYELAPGTLDGYVTRNSVQGYSADSRHTLFTARAQLTPDALPSTDAIQLYDRFAGALHLVSVLPNGSPATGNSEVGGGTGANQDRAVSADGSLVYWQTTNAAVGLLLRRHPEQGIVANECKTAAKACTVPVGSGGAYFWTAAADGSRALYTEGIEGAEDLYEFDLARYQAEEAPSRLIASHVLGVAGASEDLSRIYFVSSEALDDEAEGEEEGEPNLYLSEAQGQERTFSFVGTLTAGDVGTREPGTIATAYNVAARKPLERGSRVSADGGRLVFDSRAPLRGYDNAGEDGRPSVEVFAYEAASGELDCISCNPSGARPSGVREILEPYKVRWRLHNPTDVPAAAWIPTWEHPLHASNVLSADGSRVFFNSNDALLPRDANGAQDVYEWEAPGAGRCEESSPSYFAQNVGCLYLISSGQSSYESEFWEASPDGGDVFFTTESSLLPQDPGSVDLYDARIDGGFPQPTEPAICEGEACQSPPPPPDDPTPASSTFHGAGNVVEPAAKPCPKGKVRGSAARGSETAGGRKRDRAKRDPLKKKGKCVKKAHGKHKRHPRRGKG